MSFLCRFCGKSLPKNRKGYTQLHKKCKREIKLLGKGDAKAMRRKYGDIF